MSTVIKTRTVGYRVEELEVVFPKAYRNAYETYANDVAPYLEGWEGEIIDSLRTLSANAGVDLGRWEIDPTYSYCTPTFPGEEDYCYIPRKGHIARLKGARAMSWVENNLLSPQRVPYTALSRSKMRQTYLKYGPEYRAGKVPPCPFTGVFSDDVLLETLLTSLRKGETLWDAWQAMIVECARLIEEDRVYQGTEEYWRDSYASDYLYTRKGQVVREVPAA